MPSTKRNVLIYSRPDVNPVLSRLEQAARRRRERASLPHVGVPAPGTKPNSGKIAKTSALATGY